MKTRYIQVDAPARRIPLRYGDDIWPRIWRNISEEFPHHGIYVVTDAHIFQLYEQEIRAGAEKHAAALRDILVVPAGEASKSRAYKARLEDQLLESGAGRDTVIIAFGGGVIGDLAGYVAGSLHRGVALIHAPTSLLAQIDSCIGGKAGINAPAGKNLIGVLYQPTAIYIGAQFLATLPQVELINGIAEAIKCAAAQDAAFLDYLEEHAAAITQRDPQILTDVIARGNDLKIDVIERDVDERGLRSVLNFGHTVGHALELHSDFAIKHGFAVAAGMRIAARLSHIKLDFPIANIRRLDAILSAFGLNQKVDVAAEELWPAIVRDKKSRNGIPHFVLLHDFGRPALSQPVTFEEVARALAME